MKIKIQNSKCSNTLLKSIISYTLIEIVMVVSIMVLLMTIAMPSFTEMMKGQGVEAAGRNMCQTLKMARDHAINNNKYVAVLMPSKLGGSSRPGESSCGVSSDEFYNRAYRVCYVTKKSGNDFNFERFIPSENWEYLPEGTIFLEMNNGQGVNLTSNLLDPKEGTINKVYFVDYRDVTGFKVTGTDNWHTTSAIVFKPSGKIAGPVRYLEIGEGGYVNKTQIVTNRDPNAYVSIKIDQFTGRVSYEAD